MKEVYLVLLITFSNVPFSFAMEVSLQEQELISRVEHVSAALIDKSLLPAHHRTSLYQLLPRDCQTYPEALIMHTSIARCIGASLEAAALRAFVPTDLALMRFNEALHYIADTMETSPELWVGIGCALAHCSNNLVKPEFKEYYENQEICCVKEAILLNQSYTTLRTIYRTICTPMPSETRDDKKAQEYEFNFSIYTTLLDTPFSTRKATVDRNSLWGKRITRLKSVYKLPLSYLANKIQSHSPKKGADHVL